MYRHDRHAGLPPATGPSIHAVACCSRRLPHSAEFAQAVAQSSGITGEPQAFGRPASQPQMGVFGQAMTTVASGNSRGRSVNRSSINLRSDHRCQPLIEGRDAACRHSSRPFARRCREPERNSGWPTS